MTAKEPTTARRRFTLADALWLQLYVAMIASVIGGLIYARRQAEQFNSAEARAQWNEFRDEMQKIEGRRVSKREEPPQLQLLRDHFVACLSMALLLSSALFATLMFMIRGAIASPGVLPRADTEPNSHPP
jgi:hypothetical protein